MTVPELSLKTLYAAHEPVFTKAIRIVANSYNFMPDMESELLIPGLLALQNFFMLEKTRKTDTDLFRWLLCILKRAAIDAWRMSKKLCRRCRQHFDMGNGYKTKRYPCPCSKGRTVFLNLTEEGWELVEHFTEGLSVILSNAESSLLKLWYAEEFRDKYPRNKSIRKDADNLVRFYGLDPLTVRSTIDGLYDKLTGC